MRIIFFLFLNLLIHHAEAATGKAYSHGMVVSENRLASQIGADILQQGGNAVDAAVAVAYALAVVNPCCGNIGGGGFMTIHLKNGEDIFLNFREKAPLNASKTMFLNAKGNYSAEDISTQGYLAVGVPGTVLGLDTALLRYGTMKREAVMAPAIRLASEGYYLTDYEVRQFNQFVPIFQKDPTVAAIFLDHGKPYPAGKRFVQKDLAHTLAQIAKNGPDVFYRGDTAKSIVAASTAHGGILTLDDFAHYQVEELTPLHCSYLGYNIITAPPPSAGGVTLCEMLNILANFKLHDYQSVHDVHMIVSAMNAGYTDRNTALGDPDFVHNDIDELLSPAYAKKIADEIVSHHVPRPKQSILRHEFTDTTHISVLDKQGNAVALTYTLNGFFGAKVIAPDTGFFLNNEMDDFTTKLGAENKFELVQSNKNSIDPGKRPLSSMTPTIVMQNNKILLVIGSPGGPRITTAVLLTLLNVLNYKLPLQAAVDAKRYHYQVIPDLLFAEPFAFSTILKYGLESKGYHIKTEPDWGAVEAIFIDPISGKITGANDRRRPDGAAIAG